MRRPFRPTPVAVRSLVALGRTSVLDGPRRWWSQITQTGDQGAPITTGPDRTVLLFYEDVERDQLVPNDRFLRRAIRKIYHAITHGQSVSGFEIAFQGLVTSLRRAGCRVVINNHRLARENPTFPVGICGYPHILDRWNLPNPAVLGPGLFDHPAQSPNVMADPRFRTYIVSCDWMDDLFREPFAGKLSRWFSGIDLTQWPDSAGKSKDIDVLVYDKIRWRRDRVVPAIMDPVLEALRVKGLSYHVLRRGHYTHDEFMEKLARSRLMIFLCECETQGLAYQEAMACNVPVLAWDPEEWQDPQRIRWTSEIVPASSVPFFSESCGERFKDAAAFPAALDRCWSRLHEMRPRAFVAEELSMELSASLYLSAYIAAARPERAVSARVPAETSRARA